MLEKKLIEETITKLLLSGGLGAVTLPMEPVSGGLMHKMYKVTTDSGVYAVKCLNPEIMSREEVWDNYRRAEQIECILEKEGIPIVPSLTVHNKKMQSLDGRCFYIFPWQDGHITDWNNISEDECRTAGNILGRIHAIAPQNVSHSEPELSKINWYEYARRATEERREIAPVLAENVRLLLQAEEELNRARASLPDIICISDEDMDPKNVMWHEGRPWIIDLECLDYGNPAAHVLQLALQWSGITTCDMDVKKMAVFFEGYLAAYDNGFRAYGDVFGLAYTWVEWLEYNIRRALGECVEEAERMLGISEVRNTVNRIKYIQYKETEIKEALKSKVSVLPVA